MNTHNIKTWKKLEDGTMELISDVNVEIDTPSPEEIIAEKEAQLIAIYNEIQNLKKEQ